MCVCVSLRAQESYRMNSVNESLKARANEISYISANRVKPLRELPAHPAAFHFRHVPGHPSLKIRGL